MICPNCQSQTPDNSKYCGTCGAVIKTIAEDPAAVAETEGTGTTNVPPRKTGKRRVVKIILLSVLAVFVIIAGYYTVSRIQANRRYEQITDAKLDQLVALIDDSADQIVSFLDPFITGINDGESPDMDSLEARLSCNDILWTESDAKGYYKSLIARKGWDHSQYKEYEELFAAYNDLTEFMDAMYADDPVYGQFYSRALLERTNIPFTYKCEDPLALRAEFDSLVDRYELCLQEVCITENAVPSRVSTSQDRETEKTGAIEQELETDSDVWLVSNYYSKSFAEEESVFWVTYQYDEKGNKVREDYPNDDTYSDYTLFDNEYDADGNLVRVTTYIHYISEGFNGGFTSDEYDEEGKMIYGILQTPGGDVYSSEYEYDEHNNLIQVLTYLNNEFISSEAYEYDSQGNRISSTSQSTGSFALFDYDHKYDNEYDSFGNLVKVKSYTYSGEDLVDSSVEAYEYDQDGNRIKETRFDSTGHMTGYLERRYDEYGNLMREDSYDQVGGILHSDEYTYVKLSKNG